MNPYERIVFLKRMHYAVYWILVGIIFIAIQELALGIYGETRFLATRLILTIVGFSGQIVGLITMHHYFRSTLLELRGIVRPAGDFEAWVDQRATEIFSFKTSFAKIMPVLFVIVGNTTFFLMAELPYQSAVLNVIWIALWQPPFIVSGHSAYIIWATLRFLQNLGNAQFDVPFYRGKHPSIMSLWAYYSRASLLVVAFYAAMALVFWQSPYGFAVQTLGWLVMLSFFPLAMITSTFVQIHNILHRIKETHIDVINQQVQTAIERWMLEPSKDHAEALSSLMNVQRQVEKYPDWPFSLDSVFTFLMTLVVPIIQIVSYAGDLVQSP